MTQALLISVFLIATCGLVYELLAGTLASYLLGDTVTQFSTVIGAYMFAMGVGSWISRYIARGLVMRFVQVEMLVGLLGGFSTTLLFIAFGQQWAFRLVLYTLVSLIGMLVGLEIPLLLRILKDRFEFRDLVSQILSLDYLGALAASILFPLVLVPKLGLIRSAFLFGLLNVAVALWGTYIFESSLKSVRFLRVQCAVATIILLLGVIFSDRLATFTEQALYTDDINMPRSSPYQRIVLTRKHGDMRLFLNGHLQFSSADEYRYHEALVFPGLLSSPSPQRVLVLGGGDGLALRELLKVPQVQQITLVDLDPMMVTLFSSLPLLTALNGNAFHDPRVRVVNADAFIWLNENRDTFDFAVVDFPDPSNFSVGKLYTTAFYRRLTDHLSEHGRFVVQSTSPLFARRSYWCIAETIKATGHTIRPYHAYVPSFGEWGFILAAREPFEIPRTLPPHLAPQLRFLNDAVLGSLFEFAGDMVPVPAEVNRLNNQILVHYYDEDWHRLLQ